MKKRILALVIAMVLLTGCGTNERGFNEFGGANSMFEIVEGGEFKGYLIAYHKETKVMYAVSNAAYNTGNFTVMLDADGKPLLWEGENE